MKAATRRRLPLLVAASTFCLLGVGSFLNADRDGLRTQFHSGQGYGTPGAFQVLCFPARDDVAILAWDSDETLGRLDRAMLNRLDELTEPLDFLDEEGQALVSAWVGDVRGRVRATDLVFRRDERARRALVDAWREEVLSWGEHRALSATFHGHDVEVRIVHDSGAEERYRYAVRGGVQPHWWKASTPGSAAFAGVTAALRSLVLATVVSALVWTVLTRSLRRHTSRV